MSAPSPPIVKTNCRVFSSSIRYYWSTPTSTGDSPISSYSLFCSSISFSNSYPTPISTVVVDNLASNTTYIFQVLATNQNGNSSAPATFVPYQTGLKPGPPSTISISSLGAAGSTNAALVQWTPPLSNGGSEVFRYGVWVYPTDAQSNILSNASSLRYYTYGNQLSRLLYFNDTSSNYKLTVRAINSPGWSADLDSRYIPFTFIQPPSGFSPSGMDLWLDATQITGFSNTQALTSWVDKSSNAYSNAAVSNPTYITNALNGLPAVRLNGSSQYFNFGNVLNVLTNAGLTIMGVVNYSNTNDGSIISKSLYGGALSRWGLVRGSWNSANSMAFLIANSSNSGLAPEAAYSDATSGSRLISAVWDRSNLFHYRNGTLQVTTAASDTGTLSNAYPLFVGVYNNESGTGPKSGTYFNGDMGEILVFTKPLTSFNRQIYEGYLAWKWGLQSNLPATHPFKSNAPTPTSVFTPTSFSGLQLWLDAADTTTISLSGSSVTGWADKNTPAKTTTVSTTKPTLMSGSLNSSNTVRFTGTSQTTLTTSLASAIGTGDVAMFAVWKPDTGTSTQAVTGIGGLTGTSGTLGMGWHANGKYFIYDWAANETTYSSVAGSWVVESGQRQSSQLLTTLNGNTAATVASSTNFTNQTITVGGGPGFFTTGEIAEVLIYNRSLSTDDRQTMEGYLAWKWGLQGSLPLTHPYKFLSPSINYTNSIVPEGLLIRFDATSYSGSGAWSNLGALGSSNNASVLLGTPSKNLASNGVVLTGGLEYRLTALSQQTSWSISAWFKRTGNCDTNSAILCDVFAGGALNMALGVNGTSPNTFTGGFYTGSGWVLGSTFTPPLNTWMHICVAFSGSSFFTYSNGSLIGTVSNITNVPSASGSGAYRINVNGNSISGELGQVLIYNRPITANEVLQNYNVTSTIFST
jgi:hypothetical protein